MTEGTAYVPYECASSISTRLYDCDLKPSHIFTYNPSTKSGCEFMFKLEKICTVKKEILLTLCLDGARAGPPEKIGNIDTFQKEQKILAKGKTGVKEYWDTKAMWTEKRANMPDVSFNAKKFDRNEWNKLWGTKDSIFDFDQAKLKQVPV
jgi:hypothetical protein